MTYLATGWLSVHWTAILPILVVLSGIAFDNSKSSVLPVNLFSIERDYLWITVIQSKMPHSRRRVSKAVASRCFYFYAPRRDCLLLQEWILVWYAALIFSFVKSLIRSNSWIESLHWEICPCQSEAYEFSERARNEFICVCNGFLCRYGGTRSNLLCWRGATPHTCMAF